MPYRVISRFLDRARGVYVDPGAACPPLPPEEATRLVAARCLVEVPDERRAPPGPDAPTAPTARRRRDAAPPVEPPASAE